MTPPAEKPPGRASAPCARNRRPVWNSVESHLDSERLRLTLRGAHLRFGSFLAGIRLRAWRLSSRACRGISAWIQRTNHSSETEMFRLRRSAPPLNMTSACTISQMSPCRPAALHRAGAASPSILSARISRMSIPRIESGQPSAPPDAKPSGCRIAGGGLSRGTHSSPPPLRVLGDKRRRRLCRTDSYGGGRSPSCPNGLNSVLGMGASAVELLP